MKKVERQVLILIFLFSLLFNNTILYSFKQEEIDKTLFFIFSLEKKIDYSLQLGDFLYFNGVKEKALLEYKRALFYSMELSNDSLIYISRLRIYNINIWKSKDILSIKSNIESIIDKLYDKGKYLSIQKNYNYLLIKAYLLTNNINMAKGEIENFKDYYNLDRIDSLKLAYLESIIDTIESLNLKYPYKAKSLERIPGLGFLYINDKKKAIASFITNTFFISFLIDRSIRFFNSTKSYESYRYMLDALAAYNFVIIRYYFGARNTAFEEVNKSNINLIKKIIRSKLSYYEKSFGI